jgi:S-layer homology domain
MMPYSRSGVLGLCSVCIALSWSTGALAGSFSDVPEKSPFYAAAEYLKLMGIMQGYGDGTFRPDAKVNRAEAVKMIASTQVTAEQLATFKKSSYTDVAADQWYMPYVEAARQNLGIIDGPPKATAFKPTDPVRKAQLFKMFMIANDIDANGMYSELKLPLASDASDVNAWYYPYMRYAVASSMTMVTQSGTLDPDKELTRGDIALLLYRYYMYRDGRRTQALLSEAEGEIVNILQLLESQDLLNAEFAASRSLIAARGALASKPDENIVKGAVKTAEGFQLLVQGYKAGASKDYATAIKLSGDAWHLAEKAKGFSPGLSTVASQMQTIAKNMADEARKLQAATPK